MDPQIERACTAFADTKLIASGSVLEVAVKVKEHLKKTPKARILIFDDLTSKQVEIDLRGTKEAVIERIESLNSADEEGAKGPGRPKLGVVAREVTLLPRHWEWLAEQPGGASSVLRKLVEQAQKKNQAKDGVRVAQDSVYKFMTVMAGDLPHYEEALRAFYAKEKDRFTTLICDWPTDIRKYTLKLAKACWE